MPSKLEALIKYSLSCTMFYKLNITVFNFSQNTTVPNFSQNTTVSQNTFFSDM